MLTSNSTEESQITVYLIVNGALNMSTGKIAAQAFQACQRLLDQEKDPQTPEVHKEMLRKWRKQGTRTITRIAETEHVFERACKELPGALMIDEGMTEVLPDSKTVFATFPLEQSSLPRMLKHKKIRMLCAPVTA